MAEFIRDFKCSKEILGSLHGKNTLTRWIVYTGASNHVTGDFSNMVNVQSIMECSVGLPDGRKSATNKEGNNHFRWMTKIETCSVCAVH